MVSRKVAHWCTFGGWASLEGTRQRDHTYGTLAEMARGLGLLTLSRKPIHVASQA